MPAVDATGVMALPLWAVVVLAAFVAVAGVLALLRRGLDHRNEILLPLGLVLVAVVLGSLTLGRSGERRAAGQEPAFEMRVLELTAQAKMPGSALACLDAMAGTPVEAACEKALFASPEATAAAVSYVAAQLSLLAIGSRYPADQSSEPTVAALRRALEADRFGLVAHVLAVRHGCTPSRCEALALLGNPEQVSANLAEATYDGYVKRHMAAWSSPSSPPVAAADIPASAQPSEQVPVAGAKPPSDLFFPSAASIPPVNIMTAEPIEPPKPHEANGAAEATPPPAPVRKPRPGRPPATAAAHPAAPVQPPMQLGPAAQ
jgi:hypothetical protein